MATVSRRINTQAFISGILKKKSTKNMQNWID